MSANANGPSAINPSTTPTIKIERITNIKYEPLKKFKDSISYEAYKKAFAITKEIIQENRAYHSSNADNKDLSERIRNTEQIYNIIFFTGERGTGKTSIMLSYMEFLKDYYRIRKREEETLGEMKFPNDNLMFTGLEYIDASALSCKEDILSSVLAKMLKKWESEEKSSYDNNTRGITREDNYSYKKRQIKRRFKDVYQYLKNLRSDRNLMEDDSDMYIETLDNMAMTWNLKQAFQQLVSDYLDIMEYPGSVGDIDQNNHFLVISIDDLDLNIDQGFELLDQVRTYLMIPNIIVLLSASYEQLEKLCNNYYSIKFKGIQGDVDTKSHISRLSREYLEKMAPVQRQVRLHSGTKWAFFRERTLSFDSDSEREKGKTVEAQTIVDMVKSNMKRYLGMETTSKTSLLYYLAPDTLRELISWELQMTERHDIRQDVIDGRSFEVKKLHYDENLKWFWNTFFPTLMKKHIRKEDESIFATLELLEPAAQIRFLKSKLSPSNESLSLLKLLYEKEQGSIEEQKLSTLILIYFSMKISEILTYINWSDLEGRNKQVARLREYYDGGVWGAWEEEMIPSFARMESPSKSFYRIGYAAFKISHNLLDIDIFNDQDASTFKRAGNKDEFKELISKYGKRLINYQYLLLFYTLDASDEGCEWELKDKTLHEIRNHSGLFCLSNVILNAVGRPRLVEQFLDALPKIFCSEALSKDVTRDDLASISILQKDEKYFGQPLLPYGDLDFLIDLGMQIQMRIGNGVPTSLKPKSMIPYISRFFEIIQSCLSEYDGYKEFSEFPPIDRILKKDKDFMDMLTTSIMRVATEDSESDEME